MLRYNMRLPIVSHRAPVCNDMSGKPHIIKYVKHLDVANAVKGITIVNENYNSFIEA